MWIAEYMPNVDVDASETIGVENRDYFGGAQALA
jgi:glucose-6-phosphate 1-dehydrogenase